MRYLKINIMRKYACNFTGGYFMLLDTYNAGSSWLPLAARDDAYAVITGVSHIYVHMKTMSFTYLFMYKYMHNCFELLCS
jgi:hypothetical protein